MLEGAVPVGLMMVVDGSTGETSLVVSEEVVEVEDGGEEE